MTFKTKIICGCVLLLPFAALNATEIKQTTSGDKSPAIIGNHNMVNYYGLSKEEVRAIYDKQQQESKIKDIQLQIKDEQIKNLTQAFTALAHGQVDASVSLINNALAASARGDITLAQKLFAKTAEEGEKQIKKSSKSTAAAYRHLGALTWGDTQKALISYKRATYLEPDNVEGWNQLGFLLLRVDKNAFSDSVPISKFNEAMAVFQKTLTLGQQHHNKAEISLAYKGLGYGYGGRYETDKAIDMYQKALKIDIDLGNKTEIALDYLNLGVGYNRLLNFSKSIEMSKNALDIYKTLENKEGMANSYASLGFTYQMSQNKINAKYNYQQAIELYKYLGESYSNSQEMMQMLLNTLK